MQMDKLFKHTALQHYMFVFFLLECLEGKVSLILRLEHVFGVTKVILSLVKVLQ